MHTISHLCSESLGTEVLSLQAGAGIMQDIVADAPSIQGGLPLFQPGAGLLLYVAIRVMVEGV